ncbi:hypothetical protein H257_09788 [Aphanomyces astaci]|uniref:Uncharacterized protein n=1 Tax=Aphanomyces astaci TaxID=112090 RepID=W4G9D9_APHAT|nr:hypothetical protein H257_09788 [Aphanomyces astaci]ETV76322.1 hypothetical protein H257_09788 [Aphanomyces astaci]|eukprot:XP_009834447.1 hypothetical protein H257_09788 [Aphanomyces astaci]
MAPPLEPQYLRLSTGRPVIKNTKRSTHKHQREYNTYAIKLHIINWRVQHFMESAINTYAKKLHIIN